MIGQPRPTEVHVGGDRHGGDHLEERGADAADEERQTEGHLDLPEHLPFGHPHGARRVEHPPVDGLEARVGTREERGDREQDERDDRGFGDAEHAEQQHEQHQESERRDRTRRTGDRDGDLPPASRVPDEPADRNGDDRGDHHRDQRVVHVLAEQDRQRIGPLPPVGGEEPGEGVREHVHAAAPMLTGSTSGRRRLRRAGPRHQGAAQQQEQQVDHERDHDDRDDTGEHLGEDAALQAVLEQVAEVGDADQDADGGEGDGADGGHPEPGEDHGAREREVDRPEPSEPAVAHCGGGLPDRGVDRVESIGDRTNQDRDRIDGQADDEVDGAAGGVARDGRQEDQQRQRGDRVEQPGETMTGPFTS